MSRWFDEKFAARGVPPTSVGGAFALNYDADGYLIFAQLMLTSVPVVFLLAEQKSAIC
jgi:hypothetical protein